MLILNFAKKIKQMRYILFFAAAFTLFSCSENEKKEEKKEIKNDTTAQADSSEAAQLTKDFELDRTDTIEIGDVNMDKNPDFLYINPVKFYQTENVIDSQSVELSFSCKLPSIIHYNGFQGLAVNVGDLNNDKICEIVYYPDWYTSNWTGLFLYSLIKGEWKLIAGSSAFRPFIDEYEKGPEDYIKSRFKKIDNKSFKMFSSTMGSDDFKDTVEVVFFPE